MAAMAVKVVDKKAAMVVFEGVRQVNRKEVGNMAAEVGTEEAMEVMEAGVVVVVA